MMVTITKKSTHESVTYTVPDEDAETWPPFQWIEGNYSCDCNRELFFARAKEMPEPPVSCGEERFGVCLVQGKLTYEDRQ